MDSNNTKFDKYSTVYIPKAICASSHYPFYNGFHHFQIIFIVYHFFHLVPLPLCGHRGVIFGIFTK